MPSAPNTEISALRPMPLLRGYAASISKYTGITDPELLDEIEELMRDEYRTLDHLSAERFASCARESLGFAIYLRSPEGKAESERAYQALMSGGSL